MPSGRKKCICQICTCGRHVCPHRTKDQLVLGTDQQSAKSVNVASRGVGRKQRKNWSIQNEKQTASLSSDQLNTTFIIEDSTNLASAITVENKGNSQKSSVQNGGKWSSKQIPKTLPIRRPDNLRPEGESDFTTTHQHDFIEKSVDLQTIDSAITSSAAVKEESWNKRQIPKTQIIKKPDTLILSGPLNLETTHKAEFSETIFKSKASSQESSLLKETYQRPRTSLKVGGEFQSDSSYQSAFTAKQSEDGYKVKKGTSTSHLKSEGEMTFDQTSMDYNIVSTHVSKASENAGDITILKPKIARPESEIKIPSVPLSDETTLVSDFKRWKVEKPTRHKPPDTLQIGGPEEEDSMSRLTDGKSHSSVEASHMETSMSDYKNWQVTRPVVSKPQNNLKPEGDFHFDTTHDSDYNSRRDTITISKRPSLLEPLTERTETESIGPSSQGERVVTLAETGQTASHAEVDTSRSVQINDTVTHIQEADVKEVVVASNNETQIQGTSNASIGIEHGEFEDHGVTTQSEEQEHYMTWDEIRPKPIRPHSNLKQEGGMEFNTTNRSEFVTRSMERVKGVRPQTSTKLFDGDFDAMTMNQVMFSHDQGEKVHPIRPKSNLHVEGGDFNDETTTTREFQQWQISKPSPIIPKSNLVQEGTMDFTTTNQTEFEEKRLEKVFPIRPTTTNQISGDTDLTTTNRVMHAEFPIERVKKIVPQSNLRMSSGAFVAETTSKSQFQEWDIDRPKPIRPIPNLTQEGSMDFTTMNKMQFDEKPQMEKVSQFRPQTSSKITGDFDGVTTNQVMFGVQQSERPQMVKPKGNLQVEKGKFASDTTNLSEFQQWQHSKPDAVTPRNNLTQEGTIDFTTTSQVQYGAKQIERVSEIRPKTNSKITGEFDGTTTNQVMFQDSPREKLQAIRPHNNLQLEEGNFTSETTNNTEFKQWQYSKPSLIKPHGSMKQEGDMDFTTTNDREFTGKMAEKVSPIRPTTTTKISGEFESTTTNQAMFQNKKIEQVRGKRPTTNVHLEKGKFETETTASREFQQWEINRPEPIKPVGNLIQEGEMDFTTSNQTDFEAKPITKVEKIRPHTTSPVTGDFDGTTTNNVMFQGQTVEKVHDIRPKDNLRVDSGQFNSETTTSKAFEGKTGAKSVPIKPKSSLTQEGEFDFITSNQMQFEEKTINKVSQIRPKTLTKSEGGKFYSTTTNQAMFPAPAMTTAREIKPSDNLHVDGGEFQNKTTTSDEYQQWKIQKPTAFQLESSLKQEGEMQFETTNTTEFQHRGFDRVQPIRPKTTNKIEGDFEGTTTNQVMFQGHEKAERMQPIRQQNNLQLEKGKFSNETTNNREFRQWVKMESKETESKKKSQAAGVPSLKPMSPKKKEPLNDIEKSVETIGKGVYEPWKVEKESVRDLNDKETALSNGVSKNVVIDNTSIQNGSLQNVSRTKDAVHSLESSSEPKSGQTIIQNNGMHKQSSQSIEVNESNQKLTRDVSTVMADYGTKQISKVKSIIPSGNLVNSGDMTFTTTSKTDYAQLENSQYKQKSRFSRSEEKIGGILSPVRTDSSPQENSHHKQKSRFSRSDEKIGGTLSPVRTDSAQQKISQYKQKSRFSRSEETIGGILSPVRIDSAQQENSQYKQKSRCSRSDEKIGGILGSPGRTDSEYRSWKLQQSEIIKKSDTSGRNESQVSVQNEESQARGVKTGHASPTSPPKTPVSKPLKRFKPADNLKIESVPFDASSITKTEFQKWETRRSSSKKRGESLKQEGDMHFDTTANDYSLSMAYQASRESTKAKSKADQRGSLGQSGSMDFHTTSNSSYTPNATGTKSKMIRPRSSLKFGGDESAANDSISSTRSNPETTSRDYQGLTSTSQASYVGHTTGRRTRANRPSTSQKVGQGAFEGQTTSTSSFTAHHDRVEKSRAIRHENHNILNAESGFSGSTTYRNSFDATKGHHCPVLDLQASGSGFSFNEEKNGHIYYAPRIQG